jgi:hypothetical protein
MNDGGKGELHFGRLPTDISLWFALAFHSPSFNESSKATPTLGPPPEYQGRGKEKAV